MSLCEVPGCKNSPAKGGYKICAAHRGRMNRNGSYDLAQKKMSAADRIIAKTSIITDECIDHESYHDRSGYGFVYKDGKQIRAHIFSYIVNCGPIEQGLCVCHKCDNPRCINQRHLFLGTQKDNVLDMFEKGRQPKRNGGLPKLSQEAADEIRIRNETTTSLAREYGVSPATISLIKRDLAPAYRRRTSLEASSPDGYSF